jgi:hypothetical protein
MNTKKTNELKKGTWVLLRNGWYAEIADNMKGNTRMAKVYGDFLEIGSVYSHDIMKWGKTTSNITFPVEHTKAQLKLKETVESWSDTRMY